MAVKITITKKEEEFLRDWLGRCVNCEELYSIYKKIEAAKAKSTQKKSGYPISEFIKWAVSLFGDKLKTQPCPSASWFAKMQKVFNDNGITEEVMSTVYNYAYAAWDKQSDVWIEQLIYSVPKLAAGMSVRLGESVPTRPNKGFTPTKSSGWLNRLEDSE